jgi:hypothetical protein
MACTSSTSIALTTAPDDGSGANQPSHLGPANWNSTKKPARSTRSSSAPRRPKASPRLPCAKPGCSSSRASGRRWRPPPNATPIRLLPSATPTSPTTSSPPGRAARRQKATRRWKSQKAATTSVASAPSWPQAQPTPRAVPSAPSPPRSPVRTPNRTSPGLPSPCLGALPPASSVSRTAKELPPKQATVRPARESARWRQR